MRTLLLLLCLLTVAGREAAAQPDPVDEAYLLENPVDVAYLQRHLRPEPPRLIMTQAAQELLREKLGADPVLQNLYAAFQLNAAEILTKPLLERNVVGRRLLGTSREMLYRMNVLGTVYVVEQDPAILARIDEELRAVLGFEDWNPSHFLDKVRPIFAM